MTASHGDKATESAFIIAKAHGVIVFAVRFCANTLLNKAGAIFNYAAACMTIAVRLLIIAGACLHYAIRLLNAAGVYFISTAASLKIAAAYLQ